MAMPANVGTGKVQGCFIVGVADGPDPDGEPDAIPAQGTITFTASVPYLPNPSSAPSPTTLLKVPIVAILDDEGFLCTPDLSDPAKAGARGIRLVATDDPDLSVQGWTWTVTYAFQTVNGVRPQIASHSIALPIGATVDLTSVVKVPSSTGIGTEQAEALAASAQAAATAAADAAERAADAALPTDTGVATLVTYGGSTTQALGQEFQRAVNVDDFGAVGDGATDDRIAIQNAFDAAGEAGLSVRFTAGKTYATNFNVVVYHPMTVMGHSATLRSRGGATALRIDSSHVTVEGLTIVGNGATEHRPSERGILSLGTLENPRIGCRISDVTIRDMADTAIRVDWWVDSTIERCRLIDLTYAGIIAISAQRLHITGVLVENMLRFDADQCYGISITDTVNTVEGRSRDCLIEGCTIINNAFWTALSTHGGERIAFIGNRVIGCYRGIVFGAGNPSRVVTATDGMIIGNIVDGAGAGGSAALSVVGRADGGQSTVYRSGNLVKNHAILYETAQNGVWLEGSS